MTVQSLRSEVDDLFSFSFTWGELW